jgi:hypothetical protein
LLADIHPLEEEQLLIGSKTIQFPLVEETQCFRSASFCC